ncbi:MAG: hypothetical protein ABH821_02210 [archaeon]
MIKHNFALTILLIFCVCLALPVFSIELPEVPEDFDAAELIDLANENQELINEKLAEVEIPPLVEDLFGNETINVNIDLNSGETVSVGIKMEDMQFTQAQADGFDDATMTLNVSEDFIRKIASSKNIAEDLISALKNNELMYAGIGFWSWLKFALIKVLMWVFLFFVPGAGVILCGCL